MMGPGSFHGTLTTGTVCISMVRLSHPACAITSAEKELGTCNHPLTAVSPSRQIFLRRFSLILDPLPPRLGVASHRSILDPGGGRRRPVSVVGDFGHFTEIPATFQRIPANRGCALTSPPGMAHRDAYRRRAR